MEGREYENLTSQIRSFAGNAAERQLRRRVRRKVWNSVSQKIWRAASDVNRVYGCVLDEVCEKFFGN